MTKNNIHCTLTDAELSAKADQWIDELIASGGKSFTMQVPARPNKDTDLIFAELNSRFKRMQPVIDAAEKVAKIFAHTGDDQTCAICQLATALQQWKDGKGKEVENDSK